MMRRANDRSAMLSALTAISHRAARIVVFRLVWAANGDHAGWRARVSERQAVGPPFDQHHGKKQHRQNGVRSVEMPR